MEPLPLEYVVDEVIRRFGLSGSGYLRLNVRDGHVVAGEYAWVQSEAKIRRDFDARCDWPGELDDEEPRCWDDLDDLEQQTLLAQQALCRHSFVGSVPAHLRAR
jgi:hypothetical protein